MAATALARRVSRLATLQKTSVNLQTVLPSSCPGKQPTAQQLPSQLPSSCPGCQAGGVSSGFVALLALTAATVTAQKTSAQCQDDEEGLRRDVRQAVLGGNWVQVEAWVKQHGLEAPITGSGQTALCYASEHGAAFIVKALLEAGANPQSCDRQDLSCLLHASRKGHGPVVQALLLDNTTPHGPADIFGNSPLHGAVGFGHTHVVRLLLGAGCDANQRTSDVRAPPAYGACTLHETPLHLACRAKPPHLEIQSLPLVALLLHFGGDPSLQDDRGDTPVHFLVRKGDLSTLWLMLTRSKPEQASAAAWEVRNELGGTAVDEANIQSAPLSLRMALRCGPCVARLRQLLGLAHLPGELQADSSAEEEIWKKYRAQLDNGPSLLPFEEGGDGVRRRSSAREN